MKYLNEKRIEERRKQIRVLHGRKQRELAKRGSSKIILTFEGCHVRGMKMSKSGGFDAANSI